MPAKRGPPSKLHERLPSGETRGEAAIRMRRLGARVRHCAGAAGVTKETLWRWLQEDEGFATLYAAANAESVSELLSLAQTGESTRPVAEGFDPRDLARSALELLGRCHGYHPTQPDEEPASSVPVDGNALRELLARVAREAPHLLSDALTMNREPEGAANK
jgi:hypothetical protein